MSYDKVIDSARLDGALTATAEAIRSKTESAEPITFDMDTGFKSAVEGIEIGDTEAAFEEGRKAEYSAFWDVFQQNGERDNYQNAFVLWDEGIFSPKYNIVGNLINLMQNSTIASTKVDIVAGEYSAQNAFYKCQSLVTIKKLNVTNATSLNNSFYACPALENITFDGEIRLSVSLSQSNLLSDDSVQSIIDHLADLTGKEKQTLQFHSAVLLRLTDEQFATILAKNWNI